MGNTVFSLLTGLMFAQIMLPESFSLLWQPFWLQILATQLLKEYTAGTGLPVLAGRQK